MSWQTFCNDSPRSALALDVPYNWVLSIVIALAGLAVLVHGCLLALRFDPNAGDRGPRKVLGQSHAVWGEQLAELRQTIPPSEPDDPTKVTAIGPGQ